MPSCRYGVRDTSNRHSFQDHAPKIMWVSNPLITAEDRACLVMGSDPNPRVVRGVDLQVCFWFLRGAVFGVRAGLMPGWPRRVRGPWGRWSGGRGQVAEPSENFGEQAVAGWQSQDQGTCVVYQPGRDGDEAAAQGGDHGFASASAVALHDARTAARCGELVQPGGCQRPSACGSGSIVGLWRGFRE